ncbi:P-loop containing nucleoside triphosphate hydrolase protein [Trametes elegans]|nr:P-loop containing nucleoside triphosphate hydrolase protein [Trametes elegans]
MILDSGYSKSSKELIGFVGQLRALGAHIDLELPRIVVIGNQSAGKSSLVEAISGISVPRDAGTCTRCPMECRLSHSSGEWSCQVKIRYEYGGDGKRLEEVQEVDFGPRITDKGQVENVLRRAQAAVLRPDLPMESFLDPDARSKSKSKKAHRFSKNVVCVELTGPELADLSFVDLPGIVQNAESDVVQLVEDMVDSYIHGNSLILVALPMSDDIENQKAARLARLADQQGLRTIGVLTKPDTLTAGSTKARGMWLDVIEGRRHPLLHGYYCTRQPDDDERARGVSGAAAREAELKFFKATSPWAGSQHPQRFGTACLVQSISKLLTQIIRESLPALLAQVAAQLEECSAHLATLPPPLTTEPSTFVLALVTGFAGELAARVTGAPAQGGHTELVQGVRQTYEAFKGAIRASAPPFVPYPDEGRAPRDVSEYTRAAPGDGVRQKVGGGNVVYLEDVRRHIKTSVTRELPGNVPYSAKLSLIQTFQRGWEDAALECFSDVQTVFKAAVTDMVRADFDGYGNLKGIVGAVAMELIGSCAETTLAQIRAILTLETSPFTQNGHYLSDCRDKWLGKYKDARAGKSVAERVTPSAPLPVLAPTGVASPSSKVPPARNSNPHKRPAVQRRTDETPPAKKQKTAGGRTNASSSVQAGQTSRGDECEQSCSEDSQSSSEEDTSADERASGTGRKSRVDQGLARPHASKPHASSSLRELGSSQRCLGAQPADEARKDELLKEALGALAKLGYAGLTEHDLGKLNAADEYEEELQLMAEVRAYFQVAYKRIIDYVPLTIDHNLLYAFSTRLHERLFERLGLGTANAAERCKGYVAEDPTVVATRDELMSKKRRLENVQRALYNFGL